MQKKKIALIIDTDNWAFANIANRISQYLKNDYDFKIIPSVYIDENKVKIFLLTKDYDLVHFFWRGNIFWLQHPSFNKYLKEIGENPKDFRNKYVNNKIISTAVYDHYYLDKDFEHTKIIFSNCKNYYTCSKTLFDIYNNKDLKYYPKTIISDGVDLNIFYPQNIERFNKVNKRNIVIGWVGNSAWGTKKEDIKGVNTILKPVLNELIDEGYPIEMYFADRQERMIPHEEMCDYYSKIDLYICTSKNEGTPNPVLESMACGVPIISTDVGIVRETFGKKQKDFILEKRTKKQLKNKIIFLLNNLEMLNELSEENLKTVKKYTWKKQSEKFKKYFDDLFKEQKKERNK